ncbi:MAG TPA: ribosome small subunit-dependent GTPase A [Candidatus Sulfopaludibacter sp.]|jgi:ribosome biogenesis GTPase|nr:ribosome small subunit-dependent GTPase A [Candidatus Sulfopaludibacter sp.]
MLLESLGADAAVFGAFQTYAAQGLVLGRVAFSHRDQYRIISASEEFAGEPSGGFWYRANGAASMPVVGDWVAARVVGPGQALVEAVLPRRTCFSRRAPGKREDEQAIAANIDLVFLVCGLDGDFNLRRLERYLTLANESGATPVIVLNKADLCDDLPGHLRQTAAIAPGVSVVATSSCAAPGIEGLREFLAPGRTVALLGSSGAGKSTLVNGLLGEEHLRTGEVRESDSRGRHTTTHRELIPLAAGGALIDTPGMRELQLWAGTGSVEQTFEEIAAAASACRFRDCTHKSEPGCAVRKAIDDGTISAERWESYRKLLGEARRHQLLAEPLEAQLAKRKLKQIHKAMRNFSKG